MTEFIYASHFSLQLLRLLNACERAIVGLSLEELNDTQADTTNSIGFDVWHVVRTVDNMIHFVFEREQPVWLAQGYNDRWGLPRVDQGTGMEASTAHGLRFPEPSEFMTYITAVTAAVVPRVAAMTDDYLRTTNRVVPWGEIPRLQAIGQVLIAHGNGHLGRCDLARTLLGKSGLAY